MDEQATQKQSSTAMETVRILSTVEMDLIRSQVIEAMRTSYDP